MVMFGSNVEVDSMPTYVKVHIADVYEGIKNKIDNNINSLLSFLISIGAETDKDGNVKIVKEYDGIYVNIPIDKYAEVINVE